MFGFTAISDHCRHFGTSLHAPRSERAKGEVFGLGQDSEKPAEMREASQRQDGRDRTADAPGTGRTTGRIAQSDDTKDREMGTALRSVYQQTVEEQIPDDLLDLLGKLS